MSPPSRDELREKLAVAAESARTALGRGLAKVRALPDARPGLARTIGIWTVVILVGLALVGIAVGTSQWERGRSNQLVVPAITGTPRPTERDTSPGVGAPPNPGAPPDPGRPATSSSARPEPPAPAQPSPPAQALPSSPARTEPSQPAQVPPPRQPPAGAPHTPEERPVPAEHLVVRGETLAEIALRYNVPFEQIAADSGIANPNRVRTGQRLVIRDKPVGVEVIQPGRTLSDYARSSGRGLDELMRMNPQLTNPHRILAGGRLYV